MNDDQALLEAIDLARTHSAGGENGPFGSVVVRQGQVVGRGWNRVVETSDPTAHAEVVAIRDACRRLGTHVLAECTIYCSSEPCPMCLSAIYWARIARVVYACTHEDARTAGFDDSQIQSEVAARWPDRSLEWVHRPMKEGAEVLLRWRENPDRIEY